MSELGAYGLRIRGIPKADRWMQPQADDAPVLVVETVESPADRAVSALDEHSANLSLIDGGRLIARRGEHLVRYALPVIPPDADLLHPYLAPGAALEWQWSGRHALHGGAVAAGDGAVLLFGAKESGKSSTLAWMARQDGSTVVADDLVVIRGTSVLAGPRSIDMRSGDGVDELGMADPVRGGQRVRVTLPPSPPAAEVGACVVLEWGDQLELNPIPARERLAVLAAQRMYAKLAGDPLSLLELAARPMFTLRRPRGGESLAESAKLIASLG